METMWGSTARYLIRPQTGNPFAVRDKISHQTKVIGNPFAKSKRGGRPLLSRVPTKSITKKSQFIEDVVLLMNNLNDKAYLYNSGKIDIIKSGNIVVRKFPNKKDASLYLLKAGWQYV
jgi:hypothetical protein